MAPSGRQSAENSCLQTHHRWEPVEEGRRWDEYMGRAGDDAMMGYKL